MPACGEDAGSDDGSGGISAKPIPVGNSGSTSSAGGSSGAATKNPSRTGPTTTPGGTVVTPPPPTDDINLTTVNTTFGGLPRTYFLAVPKDYDASRSYPLVMLFHGNPGSKEQMRGYAPMERVTKRDAILVYPNAQGGAWDLYTPTDTNKDMSWIRDLPAEVAATYNIDRSRVYGFGFSGGAFMMAQMSCRFGQSAFRAVYINSGGGPNEAQSGYAKDANGCYACPGGPIPVMIVHGDADGQVVKASGAFTEMCMGETNGCTGDPNTPVSPSPCMTAPGCQKTTEWCLIPAMGHGVWDQGMQAAWSFFNAN